MEIEKGIKIPARTAGASGGSVASDVHLILVGMEVGDSVVFYDGNSALSKNHALARKVAERKGLKFCVRSISKTSCRLWRVA
jgi:hypothetical protein